MNILPAPVLASVVGVPEAAAGLEEVALFVVVGGTTGWPGVIVVVVELDPDFDFVVLEVVDFF